MKVYRYGWCYMTFTGWRERLFVDDTEFVRSLMRWNEIPGWYYYPISSRDPTAEELERHRDDPLANLKSSP